MKKKMKKGTKFERFAKKFLVVSFILFAIGIVGLNSYESNINVQCQTTEKEINTIQSKIDALDMQKQELVSFSRIKEVASSKGYTYQQSSVATTIIGESE